MEQTTFPVYKSKPMKPLLYPSLTTSTPNSHKMAKRIKGLQGYSEHYKGTRVDYPNIGPKFAPLRTRDYRKARELTLEIWDPRIQASFLKRFLKSQKNIHTIQIKVLTPQQGRDVILKRLCEIFSKMGSLNRVQIDFIARKLLEEVQSDFLKGIRCLRLLPRLKDLDVTKGGEQVLPFSVSLMKVGFGKNGPLKVKATPNLQKVIEKTWKFNQLDTIRINTRNLNLENEFLTDLVLVISKLPNFRELDLNYSKDGWICLPSDFLDSLAAKAPKIEILKLGLPGGNDLISLLKHPLLKAKSLRRTSFSLGFADYFATPSYLSQAFNLFGEIPTLSELSLRFSGSLQNEITEGHMEKIRCLRKLKMVFDFGLVTLSEKQAGDIFRSIFNTMHFLEELELHLPRQCLGLNSRDIQGLPRLKKATLRFMRCLRERADDPIIANFLKNNLPKEKIDMITNGDVSDMGTIMEVLGKCSQLRELDLNIAGCVSDSLEMTMKVSQSISKLKRLQVFRINAVPLHVDSNMTMEALEDLVMTCHGLRDLQDLRIEMWDLSFYVRNSRRITNYYDQLKANPKYRLID